MAKSCRAPPSHPTGAQLCCLFARFSATMFMEAPLEPVNVSGSTFNTARVLRHIMSNSKNLTVVLAIPETINPDQVKVRMAGTPDRPLFCLADTCQSLGILNPSDWANRLDE